MPVNYKYVQFKMKKKPRLLKVIGILLEFFVTNEDG